MLGGEGGRRLVDRAFRATLKGRYRPGGVRCPILLYHGVTESGGPWDVTPRRFRRQIEWLSRAFDPLTLSEAVRRCRNRTLPSNPAVVTFDDGLRSTIENALPILEDHDIPATHYLVPGLFGEQFEGSRVMDREEVSALVARDHEIGAHTMTHPDLTAVDRRTARSEIAESRDVLAEITGEEPTSFAYPYGAFDEEVVRLTREAGYETATTVVGSDVVDFTAPLVLSRITIMRQHGLSAVKSLIDGDRRWQRLIQKAPPLPPERM
ncbi:MAG: polysaccharide deacetylase family protein [Halalkalicoccus sp.]|nr:polysaccharide deacetylase family protein [Halalkalicoccus sp.]